MLRILIFFLVIALDAGPALAGGRIEWSFGSGSRTFGSVSPSWRTVPGLPPQRALPPSIAPHAVPRIAPHAVVPRVIVPRTLVPGTGGAIIIGPRRTVPPAFVHRDGRRDFREGRFVLRDSFGRFQGTVVPSRRPGKWVVVDPFGRVVGTVARR